ncbi:Ubiquitin conjugation factor E4 A [Heterocephalus glaber]|uniref:Ubiquitin conjugation factor E4 n=1 Tax=Heterocephalus glaber TaxID=10181 RepID=G5BVG4_HETGA|nr:Ubiquitin conjugation factor E4 A [Heterocephalus glaber]
MTLSRCPLTHSLSTDSYTGAHYVLVKFAAIQKEQLKQQSDELPASPDDSDNSVSESLDEFDYSVAEISCSFWSQEEICEQLNINHMIQRIFLITLGNSDRSMKKIYVDQNIHEQPVDLMLEDIQGAHFENVTEFIEGVIEALILDEEVQTFPEVMIPVFDILLGRIKDLELCQILLYSYVDVLLYFTRQKNMAKVFVEYTQPKGPSNGQMYQKTLLGVILNIFCLLKTPGVVENHGYFLNPSHSIPQEIKVQEANLHQMYASDTFFLNLGATLLKLCQPFCKPRSSWLFIFNPTYCALKELNDEERKIKNVHMRGLDKDTCLIPAVPEPKFTQSYSLVTENLALTEYTSYLGFHSLHDQMTAMTEPQVPQNCLNLQVSMAVFLAQLSIGNEGSRPVELTFPLPNGYSSLAYVPEFFADNLGDFLIFLCHFADDILETTADSLEHILHFITIFIGSIERMKNPHLRAKLAEVLEAVMPHLDQTPNALLSSVLHRKRVFCNFQYAPQLAEAPIKVFMDIEFTGDPHQFEQKFNYHHPMYPILRCLRETESYWESIKDLADYASKNLEAMNPPLFLCFLNLLMNDAIFLLDEAIQYLSKIKIQQIEKGQGEWNSLTPEARQEKETGLQMFGQLAHFYNSMSNETIGTLVFLKSEIKSLFVHPFLAEHIISVLNYFFQQPGWPQDGHLKSEGLQ